MQIIPPTITKLASSTKAVTFYLLLGIFMARDELGLSMDHLIWLTVGFVGWSISQGLSDFGKGNLVEPAKK